MHHNENNDVFQAPVDKLFLHRDDVLRPLRKEEVDSPEFQALVADIKRHGVMVPIEVARHAMLGQNEFHIISGKRRWNAARLAGLKFVPCKLLPVINSTNVDQVLERSIAANAMRGGVSKRQQDEFVYSFQQVENAARERQRIFDDKMRDLKGCIDVVQWTIKASYLVKQQGIKPQDIADACGLPRSVVLDRLNVGEAIAHDKAMAQVTKMNLETQVNILQKKLSDSMEEKVMASLGVSKPPHECVRCKVRYYGSTDGMCQTCQVRQREEQENGELVRCLEPNCKGWIAAPEAPFAASDYFCKKHQKWSPERSSDKKSRSISNMPMFDRDGDPIWITRELEIMKVRDMSEDHLTNALCFCIDSAKKRAMVTGVEESKWEELTPTRYKSLKDEATRRDQRLKCPCVDGVVAVSEKLDDDGVTNIRSEVLCGQCSKGKDRLRVKEAAEEMAKANKGKRKMSLAMATVAIFTLITAGSIPAGAHVISWFVDYLRALGAVK